MGLGTVRNAVQQGIVSPTQSAPQPMGGKGGSGGMPQQPPQQNQTRIQEPTTGGVPFDSTTGGGRRSNFMGGKGGGFGSGMAAEPGVLRPAVMDQYTRPFQDMRPAVMPYQPSMPRFTDLAPDVIPQNRPMDGRELYEQYQNRVNSGPFQRAPISEQAFMQQQDLTGQQAIQQQRMMQPQFMGGKGGGFGGGFNPYANYGGGGGYGGGYGSGFGGYSGFGPSYGFFGGGLGGLAALMQGRGAFYNEGGEVK